MAIIGSFKKVGNDLQGKIITLSLQAKGVRIVAEANHSNENAPSHRIYMGREPLFNAPIYANLFGDEGGEGYTLLWSRPRKNGE